MMTSLNKEDNTVQIAGDELDEPGDEESIEISGNELDEPGDKESKTFADKE